MKAETELWFRNCSNYVNEIIEENEYHVVFDVGYLVRRKIDPIKWMDLKFGTQFPWRLMLIGDESQGANEYRPGVPTPVAKYPVWSCDKNTTLLQMLLETRQHEYIVLVNFPHMKHAGSAAWLNEISILQEQYPETKLHLHGLYGFKQLFGFSFKSVDWNPRDDAAHGKVYLANGKKIEIEKITEVHSGLLAYCGMSLAQLDEPRNRCIFNIRSARRASYSFRKEVLYSTDPKDFTGLDIHTPEKDFKSVVNNRIFLRNKLPIQGGDKFHCDTCTLALDCKLYRKGAVCAVPGSEGVSLSAYFNTRNSDTILDGLSKVMQVQAARVEEDIQNESITGRRNKDINKDLKSLFDQGTKLAKLVDPTLRGTNQTNVQVNVGGEIGSVTSPKALISGAIRELELRGIPRSNITPEMIQGLLEGMIDPDNQRRAIEGAVVYDEGGL